MSGDPVACRTEGCKATFPPPVTKERVLEAGWAWCSDETLLCPACALSAFMKSHGKRN